MVRPRWIYFAYFSFRAVSIGRFSSVFFLDRGVEPSEMGVLFSGDAVIGMFATGFLTTRVDRQLAGGFLHARVHAIRACFALSTVAFCSQCVIDLGLPVPRHAVLLASRWLNAIAFSPCMPIVDAHTLATLGGDRARFGEERLYGAVAWAVVNMVLGFLMDIFGTWIMYIGTAIIGGLVVVLMRAAMSPGHEQVPKAVPEGDESPTAAYKGAGEANVSGWELLMSYVHDPKIFSFLFAILCLGMGMSLVENLLFLLFVQDMGSSNALCGFSVVVTVAFEIPIFWVGKRLLERVGPTVLFTIGQLCYVLRAVGYTLCTSGWCVIAFEPLHGVTYGCVQLASVEYIATITSREQLTTGQGIKSAVQTGLGYFLGTLSGGLIIQAFGERVMYRCAAGLVFIGLGTYLHARSLPDVPVGGSAGAVKPHALGKASVPVEEPADGFGLPPDERRPASGG